VSHSGEKGSHNEIGLINSPKNNTDDDESLHSWLLYDSCQMTSQMMSFEFE
jgi:hypothetical protein